jgi:LDH2 family malate/lactate/ureidoglycolate dehydrogenase
MVDVLAGILVGSGFGSLVRSPFTDRENPQRVGHLFMAIDVEAFLPLERFLSHVQSLCDGIKSAPTAPGVAEVFLPGEIESVTKRKRLQEGIPLPDRLIDELEAFARELGVGSRIRAEQT